MIPAPDHIEVFYVDRANGWATAEFDAVGNQIGEAVYSYRKSLAVREARAMAGSIYPIRVFGRDGNPQRTINGANT